MKQNGSQNIVTTDDVTLTGSASSLGNTVSDVLTSHDLDIIKLKLNVKWLYRYGGTGSGKGGGGTSSESSGGEWSANVTFEYGGNVYPFDTNTVDLHEKGLGTIKIHINRGKGRNFLVFLNGSYTKSGECNADNRYDLSIPYSIRNDGSMTIAIFEAIEGVEKQYSLSYTSQDYTSTNGFSIEDKSGKSEFMISEIVANRGFSYIFSYNLANSVSSVSYSLSCDYNNRTVEETAITDRSKTISLPIVEDIDNIESTLGSKVTGYVTFLMSDGSVKTVNIDESFILIPSDLFLITNCDSGIIYTSRQDNPATFNSGDITLQLRCFLGAMLDLPRTIVTNVTIENPEDLIDTNSYDAIFSSQERQTYNWKCPFKNGEYKITFKCTSGSESKDFVYYIYVRLVRSDGFYYYDEGGQDSPILSNGTDSLHKYFRGVNDNNSFSNLFVGSIIAKTRDSATTTLTLFDSVPASNYDFILSVGVLYYTVNDDNQNLFRIKVGDANYITVTQNSITNGGVTNSIYIPLSDSPLYGTSECHLFTLTKRLIYSNGSDYYSELSVFIDGILETTFTNFTRGMYFPRELLLCSGNYYVNLVDCAILSNDEYKQVQDSEVLMFYLQYDSLVNGNVELNNEHIRILNTCFIKTKGDNGEFIFPIKLNRVQNDRYDAFIEVNSQFVTSIIQNSKVPVIEFSYKPKSMSDSSLKEWLSRKYGQTLVKSVPHLAVGVAYHKDGHNLIGALPTGASFQIAVQGSTTSEYFGKNLDLEVITSDTMKESGINYVYTPNFSDKEEDLKYAFLPEEKFTLKADSSDSSHSNNNALGDFFNAHTLAFKTPYSNSIYGKYVKNNLTGFPVIIIAHDYEFGSNNFKSYLLGIYNFNLGRDSYFNLGYKDNSVFEGKLGNGFSIVGINDPGISSDIYVAEIQGNRDPFDFSLFDDTVLFPSNSEIAMKDTEKCMFGDFVPDNDPNCMSAIQKFVKNVSRAGGYIFKAINKEFNDWTSRGQNATYTIPEKVPNYRQQVKRSGSDFTLKEGIESEAVENDVRNLLGNDDVSDTVPNIDYQATVEYYTGCMAFGMVDSVQKNLNIKSFNKGLTFGPAFYDMDTSLRKNNEGQIVKYYIYSDLWKSAVNANNELSPVLILKDYYDSNAGKTERYDIPSSYLFAIAKYAKTLPVTSCNWKGWQTATFPLEVWAKWRSNPSACYNADLFMRDFFANHLSNMPLGIFNYNYRYKYLNTGNIDEDSYKQSFKDGLASGFSGKMILMFSGRDLNRTRDWLNNRFHIMDFFMNTGGNSRYVHKDLLDGNKNIFEPNISSVAVGTETLKNVVALNEDVYTNKTAFPNLNRPLLGTIEVKSKAFNVTSLTVTGSESALWIFPNSETTSYKLTASDYIGGSDQIQLYGSNEWTEVSDINFYTKSCDGELLVRSKYLTSILATQAGEGNVTSWKFDCPALKSILISGTQSFKGNLTLNGLECNMADLNKVNISGTKINLTILNTEVKLLDCSRISADTLVIGSNPKLASVDLTGIEIKQSANLIYNWGTNLSINNTKIRSLTVTAVNRDSIFNLSNDSTIKELNVYGFKKVVINGCPNLNKVNIGDNTSDNITELSITNCNNATSSANATVENSDYAFLLNSNTKGVVNLNDLTALEKLNMYLTSGFYKITTIRQVELLNDCLRKTHIRELSGKFLINRTSLAGTSYLTFASASALSNTITIKLQSDGNYSELFSTHKGWALNSTMSASVALLFINMIPSNATNISYLFVGRTITGVGLSTIQSDYTKWYKWYSEETQQFPTNLSGIVLGKNGNLKNVTTATKVFCGTGYDYATPTLFHNTFAENVSGIVNVSNIVNGTYLWVKYLQQFEGRLNTYTWSNRLDTTQQLGNLDSFAQSGNREFTVQSIYDESGQLIEDEFKISLLFGNTEQPKVTSLTVFNASIPIYDLEGAFDNVPNITTMSYFLYKGGQAKNLSGCFYKLKKLTSFSTAFGSPYTLNPTEEEGVDLWGLVDWENFINNVASAAPFGSITSVSSVSDLSGMGFNITNKFIESTNLTKLLKLLIEGKRITYMDRLFMNCTLLNDNTLNMPETTKVNNTLVGMSYAFANFKNDQDEFIDFPEWFFLKFTAVKYVLCAFEGMKLHKLRFNFFNKRYESITTVNTKKTEVVNPDTDAITYTYTPSKLHRFLYSLTMAPLYRTFKNCVYEIPFFDLEEIDKVKKDYIENGETVYYNSAGKELLVVENTEYTDVNKKYEIEFGWNRLGALLTNDSLLEGYSMEKPQLLVPPDIFYGVSSGNATNSETFYSSVGRTLCGILPQNLFKTCRSTGFSSCFYNQIVLPVYVGTTVSNNEYTKVFQFVPDGFTSMSALDGAFNFRLRLPSSPSDSTEKLTVEENGVSKVYLNTSTYLLLSSKSCTSTIISMNNGVPTNVSSLTDNGTTTPPKLRNIFNGKFYLYGVYNGSAIDGGFPSNSLSSNRTGIFLNHIMAVLTGELIKGLDLKNITTKDLISVNRGVGKYIVLPAMSGNTTGVIAGATNDKAAISESNLKTPAHMQFYLTTGLFVKEQ